MPGDVLQGDTLGRPTPRPTQAQVQGREQKAQLQPGTPYLRSGTIASSRRVILHLCMYVHLSDTWQRGDTGNGQQLADNFPSACTE